MAVYFKLNSSPASSNKSQQIPLQSIADGIGDKYKVLKPKIDKITVTYHLPDPEDQEYAKKMMWEQMKEGVIYTLAPKSGKGSRYKTRLNLTHPGTGQKILIEADPKISKTENPPAFLRFEFNPSKLGPEGIAFFQDRLVELFLGNCPWKDFIHKGNVTRLDVAIDLVDIPLDALLLHYSKQGKQGKSLCYFGPTGVIETVYLGGTNKKSSKLTVYNKAQQLEDAERNPKYGDAPHTRVEVRVSTKRPIADLAELKNPFLNVSIAHSGLIEGPTEQPHHWQFFLDSCRFRGRENALKLLPEALREPYKAALDKAETVFWKPKKVWAKWPEVLEASGLLSE